jgi:hypothetical protein
MKTIRSRFALIGCLLLMHATSQADDSKSALADFDVRPNKAAKRETLRVRPPTTFLSSKSSLRGFHSQGTAVIGGPTNTFRNTAVLNGTGIKRKP